MVQELYCMTVRGKKQTKQQANQFYLLHVHQRCVPAMQLHIVVDSKTRHDAKELIEFCRNKHRKEEEEEKTKKEMQMIRKEKKTINQTDKHKKNLYPSHITTQTYFAHPLVLLCQART